jgi:hypothetical protein
VLVAEPLNRMAFVPVPTIAIVLLGVCAAVVLLSSMTLAVVLLVEASAWTMARFPAVKDPAKAVE